ncbi:nucleoside-diphosphate sugar epimerase [Desulfuromonas versatilis]|uniref:Nucleoside-diphosphate sugar epimerase n=1 Tax=Desulfuromonas versatilis TaxID=2802975 RepID=A0ABM8HUX7_9BACT|nr:nucleoside-diphosphate sugar epimerase/dehydratase [Desulfuromonas versatilis]BCR05785.1 nucleoside-diphosphate sugar epimerase [Desulfuromonas versatilis]
MAISVGLLNRGSLRSALMLGFQALVVSSSFLLAFLVRFDGDIPAPYWEAFYATLPAIILIKLAVFWRMRLFSGWWRYVSLPDLLVLLRANCYASLGFLLYVVTIHHLTALPRSVLVLDGLFCFLALSGARVLTRILRENHILYQKDKIANREHLLIVGAGAVGQSIVREIRQNPHLNREVIGYIDNDPERHQQRFQGVAVLGPVDRLERLCRERGVDQVVIAQPALGPKELREILERCRKAGVKSKILPSVEDIITDAVSVQHIRDVQLQDLLGRKPVRIDLEEIRGYLQNKRILVTGAGGSIGSEICRQVASFGPACVLLLDNAETPLFHVENELRERFPAVAFETSLSDIRDLARMEYIFSHWRPEVVFHAAAYKHVPMSEHNPIEAIRNNVIGTRNLADRAHDFGVQQFVMVSTDKAVRPTNAMGASKRAAEIYVQTLARTSPTNFVTVRFGNVLGSNGSVVPIFKEQIRRGGPVTVTHADITRFFMTIPEAVQLVLQAGSMGRGGDIMLLDMGEPVKVLHLAEELIRLSGLKPYEDIEIVFTGLRPGEKLYEELLLDDEGVRPTRHEKICVANAVFHDPATLKAQIEDLYQSCRHMDLEGALRVLNRIVPEYKISRDLALPHPGRAIPPGAGEGPAPYVLLRS